MSGAHGLSFRLKGKVGGLTIDVALEASGPVALIGPNGAGKSSLLGMLLGALPVEEGHLRVGRDVLLDTAGGISVPIEARRWGYVPQSYALFPHLDVRANVAFGVRRGEAANRARRVDAVLEQLAITNLGGRRVQTLSGGEAQRVALARALAAEPRGLLLDEPLAALDVHARADVRAQLAAFLQRLALPTVVVTHDPEDARALGAMIAVMEWGLLRQRGTWDELRAEPGTDFVKTLVRGVG